MSGWFRERFRAAVAAAASLTGKRFGLLVASSLVATAGIVAAGATNKPEGNGQLAASLIGRSLAADRVPAPSSTTPIESEAEPEEEAAAPAESAPSPTPSIPEESVSIPETAPVPEEVAPEETASEETPSEETSGEESPSTPAPPAKPEAGQVKHVFVVSVVSSGYEAAFGAKSQMPYLNGTLRPQGTLLAHYSVLDKSITPNGIAAISGQPPNKKTKDECPTFDEFPPSAESHAGIVSGEGCVWPETTQTLANQLTTAGFTTRAYMEGMVSPTTGQPEDCVRPGPEETEEPEIGGYSARLNPFTHFLALVNLGECASADVPIAELKKDLKSEATTANFSYVSPDLCSAGVVGQCPEGDPQGAAAADAWLEEVVPLIVESKAFKKDGLLIVTFGGVTQPAPPAEGQPALPAPTLKTGALLVSQFGKANGTDNAPYDPYSVLRSTEELFGFTTFLGKAADSKTKTFAPPLRGNQSTANGGD